MLCTFRFAQAEADVTFLQNFAQYVYEITPKWLNWIVIVGGAALGFMQFLAALVAFVWGSLQIYGWFVNEGWKRKNRNGR